MSRNVADQIRQDIVEGIWPSESRLKIDLLAERYQTSHMPIREALKVLGGEGLVLLAPKKSARVRKLDEDFLARLMELRQTIEGELARQAATRISVEAISELIEIQDQFELAIDQNAAETAVRLNHEFHNLIYSESGNSEGFAIIEKHWLLVSALLLKYGYGDKMFSGVTNDHRHIIVALKAGDGYAAGILMTAHVIKSKQSLISHLKNPAL